MHALSGRSGQSHLAEQHNKFYAALAWLNGSFGDPAPTLKKPKNAMEFHWMHSFEDGKIDVILLTRLAGQNSAVLSVMKHKQAPKGGSRND